tara:strand:- start:109 stop:780 length:672 start_codon:yes stop_codon:yes gene_type:complete
MNWDTKSKKIFALLILMGITVLFCIGCKPQKEFNGTELTTGQISREFVLTNQLGHSVKSNDFLGKPVMLTFLYTNCSTACPVTVGYIKAVSEILESQQMEFNIVVISLDPERDTVTAAKDFTSRLGMDNSWEFLVGSMESLETIWEDYYVKPVDTRLDLNHPNSSNPNSKNVTSLLDQAFSDKYELIHPNPIYLIDKTGLQRVVFTPPTIALEIAEDLQVLLE